MAEADNLKALYLEWIQDYCNLLFSEPYPAGVQLALDKLIETDPLDYNIASETIDDMSISYGSSNGDIPIFIKRWLGPYVRPHLVSDKTKRVYKDGG